MIIILPILVGVGGGSGPSMFEAENIMVILVNGEQSKGRISAVYSQTLSIQGEGVITCSVAPESDM